MTHQMFLGPKYTFDKHCLKPQMLKASFNTFPQIAGEPDAVKKSKGLYISYLINMERYMSGYVTCKQ